MNPNKVRRGWWGTAASVGEELGGRETPAAGDTRGPTRHPSPPDPRGPLPGSASGTHGELRLRTEVSARRTNERRGGRALGQRSGFRFRWASLCALLLRVPGIGGVGGQVGLCLPVGAFVTRGGGSRGQAGGAGDLSLSGSEARSGPTCRRRRPRAAAPRERGFEVSEEKSWPRFGLSGSALAATRVTS